MNAVYILNGSLYHHGIKGMKWGQWNAETRAKYGLDGSISKGAKAEIRRLSIGEASNTGGTVGGIVGLATGNPLLAGGSAAIATVASYPIHNLRMRKQYKRGSDAIDNIVTKRGKDGKPINEAERKFQREKTLSTITNVAANAAIVGVATTRGHALVSNVIGGLVSQTTGVLPPDPTHHTHPNYVQVHNPLGPKPHTHGGNTPSTGISAQLTNALTQQIQNGTANDLHPIANPQVHVPNNPTWLEAFRK